VLINGIWETRPPAKDTRERIEGISNAMIVFDEAGLEKAVVVTGAGTLECNCRSRKF
jgi:hypothetical protein